MKKIVSQALGLAQKLWTKEPARVVSVTAAGVVFVCAKLGIIVPVESVATAVAFALPLLLGGELIRSQVSPVATLPAAKAATPTPAVKA